MLLAGVVYLQSPIITKVITKRNTVNKEILRNKKNICLHIKTVCFQLKKICLQRKRIYSHIKKVCLHTENKLTANSLGK